MFSKKITATILLLALMTMLFTGCVAVKLEEDTGVKAGEECEILFCGKYGFGNSTFGIIPANSALAFKI